MHELPLNPRFTENFFGWFRVSNLPGLFEDSSLPTRYPSSIKLNFMRKILFFVVAGLTILFTACNNAADSSTASAPTKSNEMAEKNLAASRLVNKAFETGDPSLIDSAVASDFVDHTDRGDKNRDSLKAMVVGLKKNFPDMKTEVLKEVADDDYVFSLVRYTGNSNGAMDMPPGPYDMHVVHVVRLKDGKGVEHWEYMQPKEMMKMMPPPADAKKK